MRLNKSKGAFGRAEIERHPQLTRNFEGGIAFKLTPELELYQRVATCLVGEPKFYEDKNENELDRIKWLIDKVADSDPEFILELASHARNVLNLRTIPIILLVESALDTRLKKYVRKYTPRIVKRADQLTEAISYLQLRIGDIGNHSKKGSMPSSLKRGLADAFQRFDEYQLAKYNSVNAKVKLRDVLRLVHPSPKDDKQSATLKRLKENRLEVPRTWESVLTEKGNTKESWQEILPDMLIMAVVRNLRNMLDAGVAITDILPKLTDKDKILHSKMFPFRFLSAYKSIEDRPRSSKLLGALEQAMDISVENLPKIPGTSAIFADNSGSMDSALADKSTVMYWEIANMMLSLASRVCDDSITGSFADDYKTISLNPRNGVLANAKHVRTIDVGSSTNGHLAVDYLIENNLHVDRIMIFTDSQLWDSSGYDQSMVSSLKKYKTKVNPNVYYYEVNLNGYGTVTIPEDERNMCLIAGWSERILEFVNVYEQTGSSVVDKIREKEKEKEKRKEG